MLPFSLKFSQNNPIPHNDNTIAHDLVMTGVQEFKDNSNLSIHQIPVTIQHDLYWNIH